MAGAGVLVDVDGTLVDSNYHHALAWSRALLDHGCHARLAAIHRLIGMGGSEMLEKLIGHDDQAISDSWRSHFDELLPEILAFEGAADLLRALKERGLRVVLATSSPADLLAEMRAKIDAEDAIDLVVSAGDVERAKPAPDIFAVAQEKAGLDRERVLVLGDSVWDVHAATAAGLGCVALETGGFSHGELTEAGAIAVYTDAMSLKPELRRSPLGALNA